MECLKHLEGIVVLSDEEKNVPPAFKFQSNEYYSSFIGWTHPADPLRLT